MYDSDAIHMAGGICNHCISKLGPTTGSIRGHMGRACPQMDHRRLRPQRQIGAHRAAGPNPPAHRRRQLLLRAHSKVKGDILHLTPTDTLPVFKLMCNGINQGRFDYTVQPIYVAQKANGQ